MKNPRVALLGFSIECNRFAPIATEADFAYRCLLRGENIVTDARSASPQALGEMPGFVTDMDAAGDWVPHPILLAMAEPNGPGGSRLLREADGRMAGRAAPAARPGGWRLLRHARRRADHGAG
jgi:hypothetical protein